MLRWKLICASKRGPRTNHGRKWRLYGGDTVCNEAFKLPADETRMPIENRVNSVAADDLGPWRLTPDIFSSPAIDLALIKIGMAL